MSYVISNYNGKISELPMREVCRYMGAKELSDTVSALIAETLPRFLETTACRACYMEVPVSVAGGSVDLDVVLLRSSDLARNLRGCTRAVLFAATIGADADRQRHVASVTSPTKELLLDAMGSAAIEVFCDELCEHILKQYGGRLHPRFSPGYGDLPLGVQKELLAVLDSQRRIGLTLSDSLMMLPQKSVTAIVGIEMYDGT